VLFGALQCLIPVQTTHMAAFVIVGVAARDAAEEHHAEFAHTSKGRAHSLSLGLFIARVIECESRKDIVELLNVSQEKTSSPSGLARLTRLPHSIDSGCLALLRIRHPRGASDVAADGVDSHRWRRVARRLNLSRRGGSCATYPLWRRHRHRDAGPALLRVRHQASASGRPFASTLLHD